MINTITLVGKISDINLETGEVTIIHRRTYKNYNGKFIEDKYIAKHWSRDNVNSFTKLKVDSLVAIQGRIEIEEEKYVIIVEDFNLLNFK